LSTVNNFFFTYVKYCNKNLALRFVIMPNPPLIDLDAVLLPAQKPGVSLGLKRSQALLATLGHPERSVPTIHVGGSNGKGSVCAYLDSILRQAGYRVGRYNSPHLVSWNERLCIDGKPIDSDVFIELLHRVQRAAQEPPTKFELLTVAAWLYFAEAAVDIAVVEVGLGGRLDATNAIEQPLVSVITSISREHWQILGETIPEIAFEKAGIMKAGCPVVIGELPPAAVTVMEARAAAVGCSLRQISAALEIEPGLAEVDGLRYQLPLAGDIQLHNSALAIGAIRALPDEWSISKESIQKGLAATRWPGRLHLCQWQGREILLDGAHNEESAIALRHYVDRYQQPVRWVIGMLNTKDHHAVLQALVKPSDRLHLVPVADELTMTPEELAAIFAALNFSAVTVSTFADWQSGLSAALMHGEPIVMAGSLYLLGDFYREAYPTGIF
jgi:dihydrofolate synthase / folylpolyglutamate synthase